MAEYKYKFSIVTAVYNVELFVAETIESIIAQDIGFENVQLILVDDGSPDNSGAICDEYAQKYPDNIVVIHKENGGVSSARNAGLERVQGKYVNFIDADDKFTEDTLSKVWSFCEKHYDETDVVAIPLKFFDGYTGSHPLNYKFEGDERVVDLKENYNFIQLSMSSTFVKKEVLEQLRFDTRLAYAEDAQVLQKILLDKQTLGVVPAAEYMYRRRREGFLSAIQTSAENPKWYLPYMKYFQQETIKYALEKCGEVPRFIQYTLAYDLQWRIKKAELPFDLFSEEEVEEYVSLIKKSLEYVDDDIIMSLKNMYREHKIFALKMKYSREPEIVELERDLIYKFSEDAMFKFSRCRANIEFINVKDNVLELEGYVSICKFPFENAKIMLSVNNEIIPCDYIERDKTIFAMGNEVSKVYGFSVKVPLENFKGGRIFVVVNVDGKNIRLGRIALNYFAPLSGALKYSYCRKEEWIISANRNIIYLNKATIIRRITRELKLLAELFIKNTYNGRKEVFTRVAVRLYKLFKRKPVWLISDRASIAGDNGEAFFRYMREKHKEIDARFVLLPQSEDFERLTKIGPVVKKGSEKHKFLSLVSEYIISSHAENEIYNPMGIYNCTCKDIWSERKFVFLQHGITQNDVSKWLGKYNKNFFGLVSATNPEYKAFVAGNYNYEKENIWLTGFARFDRLYDDSQKQITIMPTWRRYLAGKWDLETDTWTLVSDFKESSFFRFYNGLLNDERIITSAKKNGYKIAFFPHPTLQPHISLFDRNETVDFLDVKTAYKDIYAKSSLVVTDYSSAAFDFSYLKKPIVYTHFDKDEFFGGDHVCKTGYFEYERDGFGEVEYDMESTVNRIIEYMENGCQLKDMYRERIDNFFAYNDKNNCQRIYEKLIEGRK